MRHFLNPTIEQFSLTMALSPHAVPYYLNPCRAFYQAVLQEEKRVIHALRRGVEKQDYSQVKGLLAQAESMGLNGEEVKQAQAMRLRIEVGLGWDGVTRVF